MINAALVVAFVLFRGWVAWHSPVNPQDGNWNLLVAIHVADGMVPYRDFSYGATPLSLWLSGAAIALFGKQLGVLRLFIEVCFGGGAYYAMRTLALFDARVLPRLFLVALLAIVGADWGPYTTLANAFAMAAAYHGLASLAPQTRARHVWLAGLFAGLAFASKQNVGVFTVCALVVVVWLPRRERPVARRVVALVSAFFAPIAFIAVILAIQGALPACWDYAFAGKRTYAALAPLNAVDSLGEQLLVHRPYEWTFRLVRVVLPFVAAPLALLAWLIALEQTTDDERKRSVLALGVMFVAAQLAIYPRADLSHVMYGMPMAIVTLLCAIACLPLQRGRWLPIAASLACMFSLYVVREDVLQRQVDGEPGWLPAMTGSLYPPIDQLAESLNAIDLAAAARGAPMFVLSPTAAHAYLVSGVKNPTPYDYPYRTTFGSHGEAKLLEQIETRKLPRICVAMNPNEVLAPVKLTESIERNWYPTLQLRWCRVWESFPPAGKKAVTVTVSIAAKDRQVAQLFWDDGTGFKASDSVTWNVAPGVQTFSQRLLLDNLRSVRLDPCSGSGCVVELLAYTVTEELSRHAIDLSTQSSWNAQDLNLLSNGVTTKMGGRGPDPLLELNAAAQARLAELVGPTVAPTK